jgi:sarcosine oxidase subunit beta
MNNGTTSGPRVVIVGAGIVGIMTAWHILMAFPKAIVTILEKSRSFPNPHASSMHSAACFRQQFACEHSVRMQMYAERFFRQFGERFKQVGYLFLHTDPQKWATAQALVPLQQAWGLTSVRLLSPTQVAAEFPHVATNNGLLGATFNQTDGYLDPDGIMREMADEFRAKGVRLRTNAEVVGFKFAGNRISAVDFNGGRAEADIVVICTGVWTPSISDLLGVPLINIAAVKRYLWSGVVNPPEDLKQYQFNRMPMTVCCGTNGWTPYIRPDSGGVLIGCEHKVKPELGPPEQSLGRIEPDYTDTGAKFEEILITLAYFVPFANLLDIREHTNDGFYDVTASNNPVIDRIPGLDNAFMNGGYSGHGVMASPAGGRLIADVIQYGDHRSFPAAAGSVTFDAHQKGTGQLETMRI